MSLLDIKIDNLLIMLPLSSRTKQLLRIVVFSLAGLYAEKRQASAILSADFSHISVLVVCLIVMSAVVIDYVCIIKAKSALGNMFAGMLPFIVGFLIWLFIPV